MLTKNKLKTLKKVAICVEGKDGNIFSDGKKSKWFRVYDTTPEQVLKVILKAIESN